MAIAQETRMSSCTSCQPASAVAARPAPERSAPPPPPAASQVANEAPKVQGAPAPGTGEVVDISA